MSNRLLFLASLALSSTLAAQQQGTVDGPKPPGGGAGGTFSGPGDTVPGQPDSPTTPDQGGPLTPAAGPQGPATGGFGSNPYGAGANPLAPPPVPPGVEGVPGSPTNPPPPLTPASPPLTELPNSWQTWWHYNRWAYLEPADTSDSGTGGFYLGAGEKSQPTPLLRATRNQIREQVHPALVSTLLRGGSTDYEIFALQALAKARGITPPEGVADFAEVAQRFLRNGNQTVAEKAVLALGVRGEDRFLPWLVSILADTAEGRELVGRSQIGFRMRTFAAYGLGLLGERTPDPKVRVKIYDALREALAIERDEVQAACITALGVTPMPLGDQYIEGGDLFSGKTRVDQVIALLAFFEEEDNSFVARTQTPHAMAKLLQGAPADLRGRALYALLVACGPHSKEPREIQNAAVAALGEVGTAGMQPIDQEVRAALERIAYKSSADRSTRYQAMISLGETAGRAGAGDEPFGGLESTRRVLTRNLSRSRGQTLAWTALALGVLEEKAAERGEFPDPNSGKILRNLLERQRSSEVIGAVSLALGLMRDQEAGELLIDRMNGASDTVTRANAALALGMIGSPTAIEPIRAVLTGSQNQHTVVEGTAIALALLGDQEAGSRLFEILERSSNPKVQASVASAMGWIKDPRPLQELCKLLSNPRKNDTAKAWTAVAIGRIIDGDEWPWVGRMSVDVQYDLFLPTLLEPTFQTGLLDIP